MSAATIQEMVAEKIKTLYRVSHESGASARRLRPAAMG